MRVLVRVYVRETQPIALQERDLGGGLCLDFFRSNSPGQQPLEETAKRGIQAACLMVHEGAKCGRLEDWRTVYQHDMAAHAERRHRTGHLHGLLCGWGLRHQGGTCQDLCRVQFDNRAIDPGREAEVVRIDYKLRHENKIIKSG